MDASLERQLGRARRSAESRDFEAGLRRKIVGRDEAVQAVVDLNQVFRAGLNSPGRPVGNLLFLGPTGAGKTRVVEATAEVLFGDPRAVIKVDCAEFQHSHEIAKLLGSPPGYLGHRETHPLITQEAPAQYHTEKLKISFLLFDEIQKASDALWQLLLGILDKATLTLGDNRRVDLSQTMIFMTSNLGGVEITELMTGGLGFAPLQRAETKAGLDEKVEKTASEAAKRKFAPEFMNRIDKTVVFHPLRSAQLEQILEIELGLVLHRVLDTAKGRFLEGRFAAGTGIRRERLHVGQRILDVQDQLIAAGEELLYRATHDNLTGMLNRGAIMDRLRRERSRQAREGGTFGIVLVDLDHFKYVNDTCGHLAGDDVLRQAAHDGVRAAVGFGGALRRRGIPDRGAFIGRDGHDGTGGKNPARD